MLPAALTVESTAPGSPPAPRRPDVAFMLAHPAHLIGLGFGAGLSPFAPGTVGTLWAWAAFLAMQQWLAPATIGWVIAASLPLGLWACARTARGLGQTDPGCIVWDEVVAFWIVLWLVTPAGLWAQAVAFGLFRYFDAAKPGPVAWADTVFKPRPGATPRWWTCSAGIVLDDLVAAFCTLLVIAVWHRF